MGSGDEECSNNVIYYGIGVIDEVNKPVITMRGSNGKTLDLHHADCSLSMGTIDGYEPKEGDAICWKGYEKDGKWRVIESIIFPARQE